MIELAPRNPYGLALSAPIVARAGLDGAGIDRLANLAGVGAVLSDPLSATSTTWPAWEATPAGVIWPSGGRSIQRARRELPHWSRRGSPILVTLLATTPAEASELLDELDPEAHPGLVLDLTATTTVATAEALLSTVRRYWVAPLLVECPIDGPALADLVPALAAADALLLARGPRALGQHSHGRLVGPAAEPLIAAAAQTVRQLTRQPLLVGASTAAGAHVAWSLGADALVIDVALWHDLTFAELALQQRPA